MTNRSLGLQLARLTAAGLLAAACSLTLPAEDEIFGGSSLGGQAQTAGSAGTDPKGGGADHGGEAGVQGGRGPALAAGAGAGGEGEGGLVDAAAGAVGDGGEGGGPIALPPAVLFIHYTFDDVSSFTAKDSSGNGKDGTLTGLSLPVVVEGHIDGAIELVAAQKQYVQLPGDIMENFPAISVTSWLYLHSATAWDRLFDFNAGEASWFYFSPTGWNFTTMTVGTHIAVRDATRLDPEIMLNETYPTKSWHHVAVILAPPYLRYYIDGKLKAEAVNMTLKPSDVGKTHQNWIGRSVYAADPFVDGWIDDFRVYSGALKPEEIEALATQ